MTLDDLKNIDFKNVGGLPWPVKGVLLLGVLLAVVALGSWFLLKPMLDELHQAQDKEWGADKKSGLRGDFEAKLAQAANLEGYKAQLTEAELKSNVLLKQLPDKSQMDGLLTDINQAGIGRGLEFELFKPGAEKPSALYSEMPIKIKVIGKYHELGAFTADVAKMSRIVTLGELSITALKVKEVKGASANMGDLKLGMDLVAKTYRALDKTEAAAPSKKVVAGKKEGAPAAKEAPAGGGH